ncbi:MarR family transcriptional regulator [Nonomuraea thailandensis]
MTQSGSHEADGADLLAVTSAVVAASRLLVGIAVRSLAEVEGKVTLPQFRMLVVLNEQGPTNLVTMAGLLGVTSPTAMRMADRLVLAQLVVREVSPHSRRESIMNLTSQGRRLVAKVMARRQAEVAAIVSRMTSEQRRAVIEALTVFNQAGRSRSPRRCTRSAGRRSTADRDAGLLAGRPAPLVAQQAQPVVPIAGGQLGQRLLDGARTGDAAGPGELLPVAHHHQATARLPRVPLDEQQHEARAQGQLGDPAQVQDEIGRHARDQRLHEQRVHPAGGRLVEGADQAHDRDRPAQPPFDAEGGTASRGGRPGRLAHGVPTSACGDMPTGTRGRSGRGAAADRLSGRCHRPRERRVCFRPTIAVSCPRQERMKATVAARSLPSSSGLGEGRAARRSYAGVRCVRRRPR